MKIEFREAFSIEHPKTLTAGAAVPLFSEPSADFRSLDSRTLSLFYKTSADFRFTDPRTIQLPILWPLNLFNLTLTRFSPNPFCS